MDSHSRILFGPVILGKVKKYETGHPNQLEYRKVRFWSYEARKRKEKSKNEIGISDVIPNIYYRLTFFIEFVREDKNVSNFLIQRAREIIK